MNGGPAISGFDWYSQRSPRACPPKSLFVTLLALFLGLALPAVGLWHLEHYPALLWMGGAAALLVVCLFIDMQITYRRYRYWAAQWVCGDCRETFFPIASSGQDCLPRQLLQTY